MIALPSASNRDSGPSDSVTRVVTIFIVAFAVGAHLQVRNVSHVERVVGVRIHVGSGARIEMPAGAR